MYTIALETSSIPGGLALLHDDRVLYQTELPRGARMAATFAPQLQQALRQLGWSPQEIRLFAVSQGPGSFTGLRIAITAAKVFSYATGCEVLGVNTLEVMAAQVSPTCPRIWAVLDAQRGQIYAERFDREAGKLLAKTQPRVWDIDEWLHVLQPGEKVTGTGLARCRAALPSTVFIEDESCWTPSANTVGRLAWNRFRSGERQDAWSLVPHYYRPSAAEEKWQGASEGR